MTSVHADDLNTDIQAELREYMSKHDLNRVFAGLVEAVLLEQPTKPFEFLVNLLLERYGADVDLKTLGLRRVGAAPASGMPAMAGSVSSEPAAASGAGGPSPGTEGGDSDTESDSGDDVVVDTLPTFSARTNTRRISVSAEANVDPRVLKARWEAERKVYPKSDDERRRLRAILLDNLLFRRLDAEQFDIILDALSPIAFAGDKTIIKQGTSGDLFYVVESGEPEVHVETNGISRKIVSYKRGDSFGELALMYNAPRQASVLTTGDTKLWALDRLTFKVILMDTTIEKRKRYEAFLSKVPILASVSEYERMTIADALVVEEFERGRAICLQGESGDKFYIVEKGEVSITRRASSSAPSVEVDRASTGAYFGEVALLTNQPRKATATAVVPTSCLSLDRKTFSRVMGPLQDILKRNMDRYDAVMAQVEEA